MYELCFVSGMSSVEIAQWIQGLGTVGAAIIALVVVYEHHRLQVKREEIDRKNEQSRILKMLIDVANGIFHMAGSVDEARSNPARKEDASTRRYYLSKFVHFSEMLKLVPASNLPTAPAFDSFVTIRWWLDRAIAILQDQVRFGQDIDPEQCGEKYGLPWRPIVGHLREALELLRQELDFVRSGAPRTIGPYAEDHQHN